MDRAESVTFMSIQRYGLRRRLLRFTVCGILLPISALFLIYGQYIGYSMKQSALQQAAAAHHNTAITLGTQMRTFSNAMRGFYTYSDMISLLTQGRTGLYSEEQTNDEAIFNTLSLILSSVPEARSIKLTSFKRGMIYTMTSSYQRFSSAGELSPPNVGFPCKPYSYYVTLLGNADASGKLLVCMPLYNIPSSSDILALVQLEVPISNLTSLTGQTDAPGEVLCLLDQDGKPLYSSDGSADTAALWKKLRGISWEKYKVQTFVQGSTDPVLAEKIEEKGFSWYLVQVCPASSLERSSYAFVRTTIALFVGCVLLMLLLLVFQLNTILTPLSRLSEYTDIVSSGNLSADPAAYRDYDHPDEIRTLIHSIDRMMHTITDSVIRQYELDIANKTMELNMLQAQITPHFLFNTLQCFATTALEGHNPELYGCIASLGQMLRYSMHTDQPIVTLQDEIDYSNRYISLQLMRFKLPLQTEWQIEPKAAQCKIPKMILQPLIENSFTHGRILMVPEGRIEVRAELREGSLVLIVSDNGLGSDAERIRQLNQELSTLRSSILERKNCNGTPMPHQHAVAEEAYGTGNNIGLNNVYSRLLLNYGTCCNMYCSLEAPTGFCVLLSLPAEKEDPHETTAN